MTERDRLRERQRDANFLVMTSLKAPQVTELVLEEGTDLLRGGPVTKFHTHGAGAG